jgi:hypothetical protein
MLANVSNHTHVNARQVIGEHDEKRPPTRAHPLIVIDAAQTNTSTDGLPRKSQQWFVDAVMQSYDQGRPINLLITIRVLALLNCGADGAFLNHPTTAKQIKAFIRNLTKSLDRLTGKSAYIWVRENSAASGEHLHFAIHCPEDKRRRVWIWLNGVTGEKKRFRKRPKNERTEGEIACSEYGGWHMAADTRPERKGVCLAHYLGKGEPSQYLHRGKLTDNTDKPCRGRAFGGNSTNPKHDEHQGEIEGSGRKTYRMGASRNIAPSPLPRHPEPTKTSKSIGKTAQGRLDCQ